MKHTKPTFIGNPYECQPDFPRQKWLVVKNDELKRSHIKLMDFALLPQMDKKMNTLYIYIFLKRVCLHIYFLYVKDILKIV